MRRSEDLGRPRSQPKIGVQYNRSAFGQFAENVARVMGTARFLIIQQLETQPQPPGPLRGGSGSRIVCVGPPTP